MTSISAALESRTLGQFPNWLKMVFNIKIADGNSLYKNNNCPQMNHPDLKRPSIQFHFQIILLASLGGKMQDYPPPILVPPTPMNIPGYVAVMKSKLWGMILSTAHYLKSYERRFLQKFIRKLLDFTEAQKKVFSSPLQL